MQLRGGHTWYGRFAKWSARASGRPAAFALAMALSVAWFITGPIFRFNDTWQFAINTATTILTFLMVFVIQNTQSRDTQTIQIKRDELIRSTQGAHNALLDLEELEEQQLQGFVRCYESLAREARNRLQQGRADTGRQIPERRPGRSPRWCRLRPAAVLNSAGHCPTISRLLK